MQHVAIIGAGLSGLTLAQSLTPFARVRVFEKARGVSGRTSTRYADPFEFDHGAQYFTARDAAFKEWLAPLITAGVVAQWHPKLVTLEKGSAPYKRDWFEPHYVAQPKMNALCKHLAVGLNVSVGVEIAALAHSGSTWQLIDTHGETHGPFDWVVSTAPAAQTANLLPPDTAQHDAIAKVRMTGCYSVMLGLASALPFHWHAATVNHSPIGWMALNSHKPGRDTEHSLLVQSTPEWADAHMDDDMHAMQSLLLEEVNALLNTPALLPHHIATHRWRYAGVAVPLGQDYVLDANKQLAACGDWCIEGRVEAAFLSALRLSKKLMGYLAA